MFKMENTYLEAGTYHPGKKVSAQSLQLVAKTMLPLMIKMVKSYHFTAALLQQYGKNNKRELMRLIAPIVPIKRIKDAGTDAYGCYFVVTTPGGADYNYTLYVYGWLHVNVAQKSTTKARWRSRPIRAFSRSRSELFRITIRAFFMNVFFVSFGLLPKSPSLLFAKRVYTHLFSISP